MGQVAPLAVRWQQRWEQCREWLALGPIFIPLGDRLLAKYSEPHRHYHDGRHILSCLETLDHFPGKIENSNALELAIWYHDSIYDPAARDNEARSAAFFRSEFGAFASGIEKVERLILATRHQPHQPETPDAALICDIDLSILGAPPPRYQLYSGDIRREYAEIDDLSYREGRRAVLKSFLERDSIYHTRHFKKLLEDQARQNLLAEFEGLCDQPQPASLVPDPLAE